MPEANEMVVGILAVVAQAERKMISERTKAALAAVKARGKRLGTPGNLRNEEVGRARGRATKTEKARTHAADLWPIIADLRASGASTLSAIAGGLNARGIPTPRSGRWTATQVKRVMERVP
jgi:DNA invertase Pin-like site-specific DNA recombinase